MHTRLLVVAALVAAAIPCAASAITCYTVLDRNDNVIYRDTYPPVDLSDQGAAERARLRSRGEHLIAMEADRCPNLEFFLGNAGTTALNVDRVVDGVSVRTAGAAADSGTGATGAPAPASSTPTARRGRTHR